MFLLNILLFILDETIKKIENNLDQKYSGKQRKSYNHKWNVGDICAAQYHNNQKWYRAQIKNIEEDNVLVINNYYYIYYKMQ